MSVDYGEVSFSGAEFESGNLPADHYKILGVSRNVTNDEIQNAYRQKLIDGLHEDKIAAMEDGPEKDLALEKLEALKEALKVLSNPRSRANYDSTLPYSANTVSEKKVEKVDDNFEIAKVRLEMVENAEEMKQVIQDYNKNYQSIDMGKRSTHESKMVVSIPEGDFIITIISTQSSYNKNMEAIPFPNFEIGQKVKVQRSSGDVEDGWVVNDFSEKNMNGKTTRVVEVVKRINDQTFSKWITSKELREINLGLSKTV